MKVIICGAGLVGYNIAKYLIAEDNDVTVVDNDPELISKINETLDCRGQLGHASSPAVLEKAGIEDADMLIAVTRHDEVNMMACQVASTLYNVPRKLARVREKSYLQTKYSTLFSNEGCPIDIIISPEQEVAEAIVRRVRAPGAFDVMPFCEDKVSVIGVHVLENAKILKMNLDRLLGECDVNMNIMAIIRDGKLIIPNADVVVEVNDKVYFVCTKEMIKYCLKLFGHDEEENSHILLIGGGNVGAYFASYFENDKDISLRIIESDKNTARKLAEKMPSTTIINGNALDSDILEEAGIHQNDVCIAVTNDDETNLLTSLLAKNAGVSRVISLINNRDYGVLTDKLGVDVTVNPRDITASIILESIRHGNIKSLYALPDNVAEVLEVEVSSDATVANLALKDIKFPKNVHLGLVKSEDNIFIPYGETVLKAGDRVVLSVETKNTKKITDLFTSLKEFY